MRIRRFVALITMVTASACVDGGSPAGDSDATIAGRSVERYFTALADGDLAAAMDETCAAFVGPRRTPKLFATQAKAAWKAVGILKRVRTREVPSDGFRPLGSRFDRTMTIGYTLTTTRGTYSGYRVAMVYNDGRWRLCGWVTSRSARSCSRTRLAIQIDTPTSLAPRELLRVEAPPGMTSGEDRSAPMSKRLDANLGYQKGWTRTWNEPGFGGVRVSAFQYRSPRQAVAFTNSTLADRCWDTVGVFTDPAAPTAIGTRQRGYGWTGIQPPGLGPYIDNLWLVRGRTVLFVGASPLAEGSDHQQVFSMMHAILNLTNSKGK